MYIYVHLCTNIYLRARPWARSLAQGPGPGPGPGLKVYVCTYVCTGTCIYVHVYVLCIYANFARAVCKIIPFWLCDLKSTYKD